MADIAFIWQKSQNCITWSIFYKATCPGYAYGYRQNPNMLKYLLYAIFSDCQIRDMQLTLWTIETQHGLSDSLKILKYGSYNIFLYYNPQDHKPVSTP